MHNNGSSPIPQFKPIRENKYIPETAAQISQSKDPEYEKFAITFKYYRDDLCEILDLEKHGGRKALMNLRTVGNCYNKITLKQNNIDILSVVNSGAYKKLYSNLSPDVDLMEHKIQSTARIFYFIAGKYFCVRAITNRHFEINKHR